ncbi:MAG: FxsA family protein [Marinibacterium sp.]
MILFLAFLLVPLIEIGLFIQVGGAIGLWPTLAIVVITAVIGTWLVRSQGRLALQRLGTSFADLRDPTQPLAEGAMILFAGALLLTPGFFTDAVGFALLVPPVRAAIYRFVAARVQVQSFGAGMAQDGPFGPARPRPGPGAGSGDIIDGEYTDLSGEPPRPPSGWVKKGSDQI